MTAPSSRPPDERFAEWVDGCMSQRDRERFEAELRVNAALRAELAAYERTVATLREALQAPTAPTALAERVLTAVQAARAAAPRSAEPPPRRSFRAYLFAGLAAAGLMGVAVWFDGWVAPTGEIDKVAVVDHDRPDDPTSAKDPASSGGLLDAPAPESEAKPGVALRLETEAAKVAQSDAEVAESRKLPGRAAEDVAGRDKSDADDGKAKAEAEPFGVPETGAATGRLPEGAERQARQLEAAENETPGSGAEASVPEPAATPLPPPGGGAGGAGPDRPGAGPTAPGVAPGGRATPPPSDGVPVGGSRGARAPGPAPASPFAGPLPLLTVERSAPSSIVPAPTPSAGTPSAGIPSAGTPSAGTKGDPSRTRFAEESQVDLSRVVDEFLATAGAGSDGEIVWRTARGSLVLRALDPALLAPPGERDARRADSATGGGGGGTVVPLPAPRAWLIVGDPADMEVLLARLGAKVRAEGWRLQTGEFEGPKSPQGPGTSGTGGPATGDTATKRTGDQRSLLLRFRFVR